MNGNVERRTFIRRQSDRDLLARLRELEGKSEGSGESARKERRRAIRHNCKVQIALIVGQSFGASDTWTLSEFSIKGRILDLSNDGCSIFTKHQIDIGQKMRLVIQIMEGRDAIKSVGVVRWSKAVSERDGYAAGVQFVQLEPKSQSRILKFLEELDKNIGL